MVSVIIATYNRAHLIRQTLESLLNQTYSHWECLVIDDGCSDETEWVIEEFSNRDKRIEYHKRPEIYNTGLSGCRNYGLSICKGDFIQFFDDDDIMHPKMLENKVDCMNRFPDVDFALCQFESFFGDYSYSKTTSVIITKASNFLRDNLSTRYLIGEVIINSVGPLWRAGVFGDRRFNEDLHYAEEWELYCKMFIDGIVGYEMGEILFFYRKHELSNTGKSHPRGKIKVVEETKAKLSVFDYFLSKGRLDHCSLLFFIRFAVKSKNVQLLMRFLNHRKEIPAEGGSISLSMVFIVFGLYWFTGRGMGMLSLGNHS